MNALRIVLTLALCSLLGLLPGCVVWEIRDEMRATNTQLSEVKESLANANQAMAAANDGLARANSRLDSVEAGLAKLDRTNSLVDDVGQDLGATKQQLRGVEGQLQSLESIEKSLQRLDVHLASLRKTIGSLDGVIPFLDLGGHDAVEQPYVAPSAPAGGAAPAEPGVEDPSKPPAPASARRDPIVGVWVRRFPAVEAVLVMLSDGRYTQAEPGGTIENGTWAREGETVVFSPSSPSEQPANPSAAGGTPPKPERTEPPRRMSVVTITVRALAMKSESGDLEVFARP